MNKVSPSQFWGQLNKESQDEVIVYGFCPLELAPTDRASLSLVIEEQIRALPELRIYSQIGIASFIGLSTVPLVEAVDWATQRHIRCCDAACVRFGLAEKGMDGLRTTELLELGANQESLRNPASRVYTVNPDTSRVEAQ